MKRFAIKRGNGLEIIQTKNPMVRDVESFKELMRYGSDVTVLETDKQIKQLVTDGTIPTPDGCKFNEADNRFEAMTDDELFKAGKLSKEEYNERQQARRAAAFREESDPLFFKVDRGEITRKVYIDKVEEIRERYKYI